MQGESEQRPHKLSYHVSAKEDAADKVVSELESKLKAAGTALASLSFMHCILHTQRLLILASSAGAVRCIPAPAFASQVQPAATSKHNQSCNAWNLPVYCD